MTLLPPAGSRSALPGVAQIFHDRSGLGQRRVRRGGTRVTITAVFPTTLTRGS